MQADTRVNLRLPCHWTVVFPRVVEDAAGCRFELHRPNKSTKLTRRPERQPRLVYLPQVRQIGSPGWAFLFCEGTISSLAPNLPGRSLTQ